MNAVIVGCGKVGTELARTLVNDGHDVSVIDSSEKALAAAAEAIDILPVQGNGADINTLRDAGLDKADIFIAVSPSDELNLLACLIVKSTSDKVKTIARVRNPLYLKETLFLRKKLGISRIINPELAAAREIFKLLQYPALSRIDMFADGRVAIFTLKLEAHHSLTGRSLQDIGSETGYSILVCAVEREGEVIIPSGNFVLREEDEISVVIAMSELKNFLKSLGARSTPANSCLITGGGTISYYLTEMLLRNKKQVRVIELDQKRCEALSETFPEAEIIHGDGTDKSFLLKQGLKYVDAFIPLTGIDEENIISATFAKNVSNAKAITKISRTDLNDVMDELHIDSAVFPKLICADNIAQYVRAQSRGVGGHVETLYRYLDNRVEILELIAKEDPALTEIPLSQLGNRIKSNLILACIIREGQFIIPSGKDVIRSGDSVVVVTTHKGISSLHEILI